MQNRIICPHCKQESDFKAEDFGSTIECPSCKGAISLPILMSNKSRFLSRVLQAFRVNWRWRCALLFVVACDALLCYVIYPFLDGLLSDTTVLHVIVFQTLIALAAGMTLGSLLYTCNNIMRLTSCACIISSIIKMLLVGIFALFARDEFTEPGSIVFTLVALMIGILMQLVFYYIPFLVISLLSKTADLNRKWVLPEHSTCNNCLQAINNRERYAIWPIHVLTFHCSECKAYLGGNPIAGLARSIGLALALIPYLVFMFYTLFISSQKELILPNLDQKAPQKQFSSSPSGWVQFMLGALALWALEGCRRIAIYSWILIKYALEKGLIKLKNKFSKQKEKEKALKEQETHKESNMKWRKHLIQGSIGTITGLVLFFTPLREWGYILLVAGPIFVLIGLRGFMSYEKSK
jgi:hypothetical protein